jgi:hypothetical protein
MAQPITLFDNLLNFILQVLHALHGVLFDQRF